MSICSIRVIRIRRDENNSKIVAVKSESNAEYSVPDVVRFIETNIANFYVQERTPKADVHVVRESDGTKYIRTDKDCVPENNLENLPLF